MRNLSLLSRRELLRLAGALAVTGIREAGAQGTQKIESLAPELDRIISTSEPIRQLATGYGGDIGPAEGPVWMAEGKHLLFNDIHTARRIIEAHGGELRLTSELGKGTQVTISLPVFINSVE